MARSGQASIEVMADFSRFAETFQRDLNAALRGVHLDMTGVSTQIANGVRDGVNAANQELRRLGDQAGDSFDRITQQSERAGRSMAQSFASAGRQMSSVGDQMTMALSLPIVAVGTATIVAAGNFEKSMNRVKALSGATADEFAKLREQAIKLGSTTQYSASQAADAMGYLSMAGFSATQTLDALPGVLSLAAAGAIDLADAADIASNILSGYGFQARDLGKVNDILAKTFTSTNTTLMSLGETFKYVGPVAASAGVSFEEISAAIGLMGNAGIQGSEAGTALRGAIARLLKPTADVTETLKQLGVTVVDSNGKLLPLVDIVRQLEAAGADTADMMTIFGLEAGPAMQALVSQGSGALTELTTKLQNAGGTADRIAKTQMEGFNGSLDELKSAAEGLMIAIGDAGLLGWITSLAKALTNLTASMSSLSPTVLKIATIVGIVAAAIGPFLAVFGRMVTMIGEGILALKKFGGWALRVAPWLSALTGPVGWVIAAIIALGVAAVVAYKKSEKFRKIVDKVFRSVANAAKRMWRNAIMPAFLWIVAMTKVIGAALVRFWGQIRPVFVAWGAAIMRIWNSAIRPALGSIGSMFGSAGSAIADFWSGSARPALSSAMKMFSQLAVSVRAWWAGNGDNVMRQAAAVVTWLGGVMANVWTGIMAVLKGAAAVITWVIVNVSIPLWKLMISIIRTVVNVVMSMKSVWIIIGAVIVAAVMIVVGVVKVLWAVITTVFRAVAAIVQWLWTSVIVPAFQGIGIAIQASIAVITWLWGVLKPVFTAIGVIINAVGAAMIVLWTSVFMPAFQAIGAVVSWVWSSIIMPVFNAIVAAIEFVVAAGTWFGNTFGPIFMAVGNLIWTVWSGVISVVFALFKLEFTVIVAVLRVFWAVIQSVFMAVAAVMMVVWSTVIQPVLSAIGALFTWLWEAAIQPALAAIGAFFQWLWSAAISPVINSVVRELSWMWGVIQTIFNAVVAFIRGAINEIVSAANGVTGFVNSISNHFQRAVNAIKEKINTAVNFVRGLPGQIISAIGNLGSLLYTAGQNVINGLINGIESRIGALRQKIANAAQTIRNALPFSPAKEGPLSGRGDPTIAGGVIVQMVAEGIRADLPDLRLAAFDIGRAAQAWWPTATAQAGQPQNLLTKAGLSTPGITIPPRPPATDTGGARGGGNTYNVTVNSLDPKAAGPLVIKSIKEFERTNGKGWRAP